MAFQRSHFTVMTFKMFDKQTHDGWISLLNAYSCSDLITLNEELNMLKEKKEDKEKIALLELLIKSDKNLSYTSHRIGSKFLLDIEIKIAIK